jgi:hypothetical protein
MRSGPTSQLALAADILQRASESLQRAANQNDGVQKAIASISTAIDDVAAATKYVEQHPEVAKLDAQAAPAPDFTAPPRPAPNRNVMLEQSLTRLRNAFDAIGRAPGGDLGGLRGKINTDISKAAADVIAAINSANASFASGRRGGQ